MVDRKDIPKIMMIGGVVAVAIGVLGLFILDLVTEGLNLWNKDTTAVSEFEIIPQSLIGVGTAFFIVGVVLKLKCWGT